MERIALELMAPRFSVIHCRGVRLSGGKGHRAQGRPGSSRDVGLPHRQLRHRLQGGGQNTAKKIGGGAALGALIGAVADGGKGAAIGAAVGAGAGTAASAATAGKPAGIPAQTRIPFALGQPLTVPIMVKVSSTIADASITPPERVHSLQGPWPSKEKCAKMTFVQNGDLLL